MGSTKETRRGGLAGVLERLVPRWADREDSEHEQAAIRVLVGGVAIIYFLGIMLVDHQEIFSVNPTSSTITLFLFLAAVITVWLFVQPGISVSRRLLGAITDIGATSMALYINGNLAAPLFSIYLWVSFGNGFRFGRKYLFFSMVLSIVGYTLVLLYSELWVTTVYVSVGLFIGLIVLPLYVSALLGRMTGALQESQTANEAKSNFLAVMSHEIRTPLSGIVGIISLLKQTQLDKTQRHYVKLIENSSGWLSRVLSDGLDYSKIEAGELVIEPLAFDLREMIDEVSEVFQEVASARGLTFHCHIDSETPRFIVGDQFKLIQVLNNLISNACKFTESGSITLAVTAAPNMENESHVVFQVSDTGIGIPPEKIKSIFEPFRQVDSSMSRKREGSGLGLAIAGRLARLLGGIITVESEHGKGSVFRLELPFPLAPERIELEKISQKDLTVPSWKRPPSILLVEDNAVNQEVLSHLLEALGCKVDAAYDGKQGIEMAVALKYDLIFMDCQMPVMDGYEATHIILGHTAKTGRAIPIIALTAHVTMADKQHCFEVGMSDYLGKPCDLPELSAALRKWLPELQLEKDTTGLQQDNVQSVSEQRVNLSESESLHNRKHVHELRNSYTKIMGSAELVLLGNQTPKQVTEYLKTILAEVKKAAEISERIT